MKIHHTKLPKVQRFPCSKKDVKSIFQNGVLNWVGFAWPYKIFSFDSRCTNYPKINGNILADVTISRDLNTYACFYPVLKSDYSDEAAQDFVGYILPNMLMWIKKQLNKPGTQILGYETLIIEWFETKHELHEIRYL